LTLGVQNLSFRGHNEKTNSENRGIFLAVIDLLAKYNPVLSEKNQLFKCHDTNDIVDMLAECVKNLLFLTYKKFLFFVHNRYQTRQ